MLMNERYAMRGMQITLGRSVLKPERKQSMTFPAPFQPRALAANTSGNIGGGGRLLAEVVGALGSRRDREGSGAFLLEPPVLPVRLRGCQVETASPPRRAAEGETLFTT